MLIITSQFVKIEALWRRCDGETVFANLQKMGKLISWDGETDKYDWLIQLFLVHRSLYNDRRAGQMKDSHTSTIYMLFVIYMLTVTVLAWYL